MRTVCRDEWTSSMGPAAEFQPPAYSHRASSPSSHDRFTRSSRLVQFLTHTWSFASNPAIGFTRPLPGPYPGGQGSDDCLRAMVHVFEDKVEAASSFFDRTRGSEHQAARRARAVGRVLDAPVEYHERGVGRDWRDRHNGGVSGVMNWWGSFRAEGAV